ncbi:MAG: glycosyltransferase family 4 protein [Clostridia bacterium]|nr:glycosyltransferase family 4 protein [Clostridia bacterium]
MKKIIYIGPFKMPDKNAGAHRVLNNARAISKLGYQVIFVGMNEEADLDFAKTHYTWSGFDIYEINCKSTTEKIKKYSDVKYIDYIVKNNEDVAGIIAYDYYAPGLRMLKKYAKKKNLKLIADTDEWFEIKKIRSIESIIRILDSEMRMRFYQPRIDGIITISTFLKNYYENKLPTMQVPPLVDKSEEKWQEDARGEDGVLNLVYSGSPGGSKDRINVVVGAVAECEVSYKLRLNIIGVSKEQFLKVYPESKEALEASVNEIVFHGRVEHKVALTLLKSADFAMFLRDDNRVSRAGFPTKFVESISAGVPVITNRTSNISDFLTHGQNGFFVDINNANEEIKNILSQDIDTLKAIKANVNADMFDYNNFVEEFKKVFNF